MRSRVWVVLLVLSLGVNAGFLLHWLRPRLFPARAAATSTGWHSGPMKRHLGLSSGQAWRMEGEHRQVLSQVKPFQDELRRQRRELFELMKNRDVREADLDATLNEISRLQAKIEKMFVLHVLKVRNVFSPEQLRKYEGFLERGLCPGMMGKDACPAGRADALLKEHAAHGRPGAGRKHMRNGNPIKEVLPDDTQKDL